MWRQWHIKAHLLFGPVGYFGHLDVDLVAAKAPSERQTDRQTDRRKERKKDRTNERMKGRKKKKEKGGKRKEKKDVMWFFVAVAVVRQRTASAAFAVFFVSHERTASAAFGDPSPKLDSVRCGNLAVGNNSEVQVIVDSFKYLFGFRLH